MFDLDQGGLLDVALAPDFATTRLVYLSYADLCRARAGRHRLTTAAGARGRLNEATTALEETEVIFRQEPKVTGSKHFGSRLAFSPDGRLFVTLGERSKFQPAQDLSNHLGTIVRMNPDGSVPQDNPFVGKVRSPKSGPMATAT